MRLDIPICANCDAEHDGVDWHANHTGDDACMPWDGSNCCEAIEPGYHNDDCAYHKGENMKRNKLTHTPGPWMCQPIGDETECNILGSRRELIATVSDNDANLIAAAPELLAALKRVTEQLAHKFPGDEAWADARAAIAKAEGK